LQRSGAQQGPTLPTKEPCITPKETYSCLCSAQVRKRASYIVYWDSYAVSKYKEHYVCI